MMKIQMEAMFQGLMLRGTMCPMLRKTMFKGRMLREMMLREVIFHPPNKLIQIKSNAMTAMATMRVVDKDFQWRVP